MVAKKRKSKRQTLQQKYKIVKRTKEHHRKLKKGKITSTANQLQRKNKMKREENRIPNAWPYKDELLKEIQSAKERMEEVKQRQKEKRKEEVMKRRGMTSQDDDDDDSNAMDESEEEDDEATSLAKKNAEVVSRGLTSALKAPVLSNENSERLNYDDFGEDEKQENSNNNLGQNSRRAYLRELRKVVERADIILHVVDARDPLGTKSSTIEEMVAQYTNKKLVLVMNKSDLVPMEVLQGWLAYLRQFHPTIPFKCNTQQQKGHLSSTSGKIVNKSSDMLQLSQSIGGEELLNLLKNYCRIDSSTSTKTIITVGIVGFPNVGKSSLINSLMRIRAVGVSATPGFTKSLQEVILDKNIRLIDSPGVVFADGNNPNTALRNVINIEDMDDVITPIQAIVERCPASYLMQVYNIPKFAEKDYNQFLLLIAKSMGKLKKGGIANVDAAAKMVLHDWNHGKIKYYCKPPAASSLNASAKKPASASSLASTQKVQDVNDLIVKDGVDVDLSSMIASNPMNVNNQANQKKSAAKSSSIQLLSNVSDEIDFNNFEVRVINQLHEENKNDIFVAMEGIGEAIES